MSTVPAHNSEDTLVNEFVTKPVHPYLPLLQAARALFLPEQLQKLLPVSRSSSLQNGLPQNGPSQNGLPQKGSLQNGPLLDHPIAATEILARDYLAKGGKYSRPFITLAAYRALASEEPQGQKPNEQHPIPSLPDAVCRVALSIETFHKASLVHDDIEDDDAFRYGEPTLHRALGLPTAINVGDYLIGLGYRLVSCEMSSLGPEVAGEILDRLADAHLRLSEGQGAELLWRDASNHQLSSQDAIDIYALKTAPAFEAALLCGLRCATPLGPLEQPLKQLANTIGIAFQILNDLKDWHGDQDNKLSAGLDTLGGRPTLLWALALERLDTQKRSELIQLSETGRSTYLGKDYPSQEREHSAKQDAQQIARVGHLYQQANVFEHAKLLVKRYQEQAQTIADSVEPERLRELLHFLIDSMLNHSDSPSLESFTPSDFC